MTVLWPRLSLVESSRLFAGLKDGEALHPNVSHVGQTFAHVGSRVRAGDIERLRTELVSVAEEFGFPRGSLVGDRGLEFDLRVAPILRRGMAMSWSEASSREVWSFLALVVLPDVTDLRWAHRLPERNEERWIGRDLTRHTWARIWWRMTSFGDRYDLLEQLNESELNQLVERRSIGGHPQLLAAVADAFLAAVADGAPRRSLVRDVTKRVVRRLPYIDDLAMTDKELQHLGGILVAESRTAMGS